MTAQTAKSKWVSGESGRGYALLDSGDGEKLERFGEKIVCRPAGQAVWRKKLKTEEWERADARFSPSRGWGFRSRQFQEWLLETPFGRLELRLQENGQLGIFPEHSSYLERAQELSRTKVKSVLNLFAYTGLASVFFAGGGASVCHVDLSKKALTWAKKNLEINEIPPDRVRLICDDALKFLNKEARRGHKYDMVICDPPSFSRVSKTAYWKLSESANQLVESCAQVVAPKGTLIVTCHDPEVDSNMLKNLLLDHSGNQPVFSEEMALSEAKSLRKLSAGSLAIGLFP